MPCFGTRPDERLLNAERRVPPDSGNTAEPLLHAYRVLDRRSNGRYRDFLKAAARCTSCGNDSRIPLAKQPIPLMCGSAGLDGAQEKTFEEGHRALEVYRRTTGRNTGSLYFNPDDGASELESFLDQHDLKGLAVGHCGWGDLTARIRSEQLGEGVDLMVLGADWYPLTQCGNFLLDRYSEREPTLSKFFGRLDPQLRGQGFASFTRTRRVYFGNALLCFRTGWRTTGDKNLSPLSFENCRAHLQRHLEALSPRLLVSLGVQACRSVAALLRGDSPLDDEILDQLRAGRPLRRVMEPFCANVPRRAIQGHFGDQAITFLPLYHPAYGHVNHYQGDYETLNELLLGDQQEVDDGRLSGHAVAPAPIDIHALAKGFLEVARIAGVRLQESDLDFEVCPAPHDCPTEIPEGKQVVYVFMTGEQCLKVGKAGPKSKARFTTQHYGLHAKSTLARSILANRPQLAGMLADSLRFEVESLTEEGVGAWIRKQTSRIHIFLPASLGDAALALLEAFVQCRLNPCFEGKPGPTFPVEGK